MRAQKVLLELATVVLVAAGCASLQEGLSKNVQMSYDQTTYFRTYSLGQTIPWNNSYEAHAIVGEVTGVGKPVEGFWVVYVICDLRNEASKAQTFHYDVHKFFVEYEGKKFFVGPLKEFTFSSYPDYQIVASQPATVDTVNKILRNQIQLGNDTVPFNKGFYPSVNYRFAIYVLRTSPGQAPAPEQLALRYEGYPNLMLSRGHAPAAKGDNPPTSQGDLPATCRPQVK